MLKIKLSRVGKKGQPQYRIVVQEEHSKLTGTNKAQLGFYNPSTNPSQIKLDHTAYLHWLSLGAQPTSTVRNLASKNAPAAKKPKSTKKI
ncbi:MAG: ribosomal protein S16, small subunit ribosomal protein S16 [Microgenomates group bacterium GW2011_GWC1_46_16]|uniref:Small ribosomal subunit protein bS16 n=2 Tax=Candidatus Collieribacteriota TaxID=1752725 RepID=A0A1F5G0G6_9BACT|nr:MAG: 30S ribosomal protein S16 [Microgenomates group bacterium GW2011_GWF1_46_12]KKU26391.1 MAG: ribosomal protein S16, small subunit ribosomal protein S16 [Microgenomates group bacterium GW2011_GWC1_46_16]KKU27799.1 MAG: 30S ribosomal protein S16 [Microgenomates group bacterium GW2011_GWF2_46_18]KKU43835.1 MAG: 30S ribosomal protein S16 [Microgenomates group bacterium GW2011_GWA1_46_7]KKU45411.1 MAG: 30S ribosomal protein S16 [Microgenomates group bacterium GW2011_GWB1_46_7]KKU61315.1 MAG: